MVEVDEAVVHVHVLVQGGHQVPAGVRCQVFYLVFGAGIRYQAAPKELLVV